MKEVPLLVKIDGKNAYFRDGSFQAVDAIIFCTGYLYYFPFLDDNLHMKSAKSFYSSNLYKIIVYLNQPHLFYLGMQRLTFSFNVGNLQAWYVRDVILGKLTLPLTKEEMNSEIIIWQEKAKAIQNWTDYCNFQKEYIHDLANATDYPRFDVDGMFNIFLEHVQSRVENILTYREKTYRSTLTNTMATQHHTPWLNEMDDTLENFIRK